MKIKKKISLIDQHDKFGMWGGKFGGNFDLIPFEFCIFHKVISFIVQLKMCVFMFEIAEHYFNGFFSAGLKITLLFDQCGLS